MLTGAIVSCTLACSSFPSQGDFLYVGIYDDSTVNNYKGRNYPIMNIHERVLNVLSCKFVDEVVIGAPFDINAELIKNLNITTVARVTSVRGRAPERRERRRAREMIDGQQSWRTRAVPGLRVADDRAFLFIASAPCLTFLSSALLSAMCVLSPVQSVRRVTGAFDSRHRRSVRSDRIAEHRADGADNVRVKSGPL
jgi:glycerol-3-phosphate cytidylyltransferase-like family protein